MSCAFIFALPLMSNIAPAGMTLKACTYGRKVVHCYLPFIAVSALHTNRQSRHLDGHCILRHDLWELRSTVPFLIMRV